MQQVPLPYAVNWIIKNIFNTYALKRYACFLLHHFLPHSYFCIRLRNCFPQSWSAGHGGKALNVLFAKLKGKCIIFLCVNFRRRKAQKHTRYLKADTNFGYCKINATIQRFHCDEIIGNLRWRRFRGDGNFNRTWRHDLCNIAYALTHHIAVVLLPAKNDYACSGKNDAWSISGNVIGSEAKMPAKCCSDERSDGSFVWQWQRCNFLPL